MDSDLESLHPTTRFNRNVFSAEGLIRLASLAVSELPQITPSVPQVELPELPSIHTEDVVAGPARRQLRGFSRVQPPADEFRDKIINHFDPTGEKIKTIVRLKMTEMYEAARDVNSRFTPEEIAKRASLDPGMDEANLAFLEKYAVYLSTSNRIAKPRHRK